MCVPLFPSFVQWYPLCISVLQIIKTQKQTLYMEFQWLWLSMRYLWLKERFSILYGNLIKWEFKLTYFINASLLVFCVAQCGKYLKQGEKEILCINRVGALISLFV